MRWPFTKSNYIGGDYAPVTMSYRPSWPFVPDLHDLTLSCLSTSLSSVSLFLLHPVVQKCVYLGLVLGLIFPLPCSHLILLPLPSVTVSNLIHFQCSLYSTVHLAERVGIPFAY